MTNRLLIALRRIADDCDTIAAAARKALKEIESAQLLGTPVNADTVQRYVTRLERRLLSTARRIGIRPERAA